MKCKLLFPCAALSVALLVPLAPRAQGPRAPGPPAEPEFMQALFPPELIMKSQREIGLREEQKQAITSAIQETQARTLELQWEMSDAQRELARLVREVRVDENAALEQATRVMDVERRVKLEHLRLVIRIKNVLDAEQQARLAELRPAAPRSRP